MQDHGWEHFHHMADIGVRGWAPDLPQAFEQAALAMTAVITDLETIQPKQAFTIECEADGNDILFLDWLNALIYEMAINKILFSKFQVNIEQNRLHATVWGEKVDIARHQPGVEIKGATFTALDVHQNKKGIWIAQCIVDV